MRGPRSGVGGAREALRGGTLGTFAGVFTPSILTILGIILFLRVGYVVGAGGLGRALAIILMANAISVLTSISLSAIATNFKVKAGGDYYLISRTLGIGFGGALGLVLFLSQAVSIAFYAIGFGEALAAITGGSEGTAQIIAAIAIAALFLLAWLGADWATKFQYVVMAILFAAILSFFAGAWSGFDGGLVRENLRGASDVPFWALFAIFFPAVTGFTQGVSMSGDLRNAGRSIPTGTFLAVGISVVVYVLVAIAFAGTLPNQELASDYSAMRRVSSLAWLADAGVVAATLSSALASFLGAPRILQSLASDRLFPFLRAFAKGTGAANNPRRGVLLSAGLALVTVAVGDLNLIAPVVSMFFLISYGLLNFATFVEARSRSPFFRPRFRFFDARLSLLGALGCLAAMIALNPVAAAVALALLAAIYQYLERSVTVERWADSSRSVRFQRIRENLEKLSAELAHPRDWRPVILAFSENPERRERLLRFADWFDGDAGLTTAVQVLQGEDVRTRKQRDEVEASLSAEIAAYEVRAFALAVTVHDLESALPVVLQSHGLGPIRANTMMANWLDPETHKDEADRRAFGRQLRLALAHGCHVLLLDVQKDAFSQLMLAPRDGRRIDVVYRDDATSRLSLLFAYLMTREQPWEEARIRLIVEVELDGDRAEQEAAVLAMLEDVRIPAEVSLVDRLDGSTLAALCADSSFVFVPLRVVGEQPVSPLAAELSEISAALPRVAYCMAAQDVELDAEPEAGVHGEIAAAQDAAEQAEGRVNKSEAAAAAANKELSAAEERLERARAKGEEPEVIEDLEKAVKPLAEAAESARRRAARDRVKAETAEREAGEAGAVAPPTATEEGRATGDGNGES